MAMLQRRFASSIYAVRRSLERMKEDACRAVAKNPSQRSEKTVRRGLQMD